MNLLKIIHGYPMLYNAGSEVYSQSICNELSKTHKVSIFTREENPFHHDFEIRVKSEMASRTVYYANMPRSKDGYRHADLDDKFGELIDEIRPAIAHIGHLNHLSTGLVDQLAQRNIPIVYTLHDFWLMCPRGQFLQRNFGEEGELYKVCGSQEDGKCARTCYSAYFSGQASMKKVEEDYWTGWIRNRMKETHALARKVDLFIAPSHYLRERYIRDFGLAPSQVIYLDYGFPLTNLQADKEKATQDYTFGYIGTHIPAKGIHQLLDAFQQLRGPSILKIWGRTREQSTAWLKVLAQHASENEVRIEWMGEYVNENITTAVFRHCDVIVVPSIWGENSPLVIHEAQACKVPVITANFGGMCEYVRHMENGLLFTHRDPESLAKQMQWALENPKRMKQLGQRGYLHSKDGAVPDITSHCQALESIYQQTIESHGQ